MNKTNLNPKYLFIFCLIMSCFLGTANAQRYWNVAAKFEGNQNSFIKVTPYSGLSNINGSFSVECWFKADNASGGTLFGNSGLRLLLEPYNGKLRGRMQTNNNTKLYTKTTSAMKTGVWYHIACVYSSSLNRMSFYINGQFDTSLVSSNINPTPTNENLYIGSSVYGHFNGTIDDIRIWNIALPESQILTNFRHTYVGALNSNNPNFYDGLVMSSNFDFSYTANYGLYMYDGYNTFEAQNVSAVYLGDYPAVTTGVNFSLYLNNGGYARVASNPDIEFTGPVTAEAWIYPFNSADGYQYIFRKGVDYGAYLDPNGYVRFVFNALASSSFPIPSNKWTHIAITCNEIGTGKIYINGELNGTYNFGSRPSPGSDSLFIGSYNYFSKHFTGYIDAVRISNYVKGQDEIKNQMFKMIDYYNRPDPPNSTASYNFDFQNNSSTLNGYFYELKGAAKYSDVHYLTPVSPLLGLNIPDFPQGYFIKYSGERIPQTNTAGYMKEDSIEITTNQNINDIKLFLALNHTNLYDLKIYLFSPEGDSVLVWNQNQGNNIGNIITVFDDNADSNIINYRYVYFGPTIKPFSSFSQAFAGKNSLGFWKIKIIDLFNANTGYLYGWGLRINNAITNVTEKENYIPQTTILNQNYPNPFNPSTTISFTIGQSSSVKLRVFNLLGEVVATLIDNVLEAGEYSFDFYSTDLAAGLYFYSLETTNYRETKKMILLK